MIRKIFFAIGLGIAAIGTASANTLSVYGCDDCSLSQARQIAMQEATPNIVCRAPHGEENMSEQNQQCFSQPRNYHILDKSRNRVYGFSLSHSNQGMQDWDLQLQVKEISVSTSTRNAILKTAEFYDHVEGAFEHLASSQSRSFTSPTQTNFAQARMAVSSFSTASTSSSCSNDPAYQATYNAFSPAFRADLVRNLNREYDTLGGNHHAHFQDIRFSDSSFYVSTSGIGVNYQVEAVTTNRYVEFKYNWENNYIPNFETRPHLVFTLSIDKDGIDASLNERLTRIDGVSIRQLRDPLGVREGVNKISECAREALDVFFDSSKETNDSDGGGGYVPGDGSGGGSGSGAGWSGGGSGGPAMCKQHYYWRSGEKAFTMLVPCA